MKYALIDHEIHIHQREQDTFWPISNEEAQHIVDVMNALSKQSSSAKSGEDKLMAIAALVLDVQNTCPLKGTDQ